MRNADYVVEFSFNRCVCVFLKTEILYSLTNMALFAIEIPFAFESYAIQRDNDTENKNKIIKKWSSQSTFNNSK